MTDKKDNGHYSTNDLIKDNKYLIIGILIGYYLIRWGW